MSAQEDQGMAAQMAEWLGLDGDDAEGFVNQVMQKKGHRSVTSWADAEDSGKKEDKSGFGKFLGSGDSNKAPWSQYQK